MSGYWNAHSDRDWQDQCGMYEEPEEEAVSEPGYWMAESTGVLRPAVEAYLHGEPLTHEHIAVLRAYLRQWIFADWPVCVDELRAAIEGLTNRAAIEAWLDRAEEMGVDPI